VVEDEPALRTLMRLVLGTCGYTVLEASNGDAALRVHREYDGPIHLLLTDVIMPGISGQELARRLVAERAGLRVMYISGHAADVIAAQDKSGAGGAYLPKPLRPEPLARAIRHLLDTAPDA
jgi:CheY-like chemotaxis protein